MSARHSSTATYTLSFGGILRSEWVKLWTLRSTFWCYGIMVLLTIGLGLLYAATVFRTVTEGPGSQQLHQSMWVASATLGISFAQLVVAVLGALAITGEYGSGMIRSTLTAVPSRTPALVAKTLVFGVTTFVVTFVALAATALLTLLILPGRGIEPDIADGRFWLAVVGGAGYVALIGVLALGLGTIIRNSAGGIAAALGLLLVLPVIMQLLSFATRATWVADAMRFLPSDAGGRMYAYELRFDEADGVVTPPPPGGEEVLTLMPWQGAAVLGGWCLVLLVVGGILLKRRDA